MTAFAIGIGIAWLAITLRGKSYTISGLSGLVLTGFICYGLGSLVLLIFKR
jgi:hypothetical protein